MFFNLILSLLDALILGVTLRCQKVGACAVAGMLCAMAAVVVGIGAATSGFHLARLAAYGIFLHAPIVMLGVGIIWWKRRRLLAVGSFGTAAAVLALGGYAFLVEPYWLEITHYEIASPKIERPLRIAVLADLQMERFGDYERCVLDRTLEQKPDIILLAGDYLQCPFAERSAQLQAVNAYLRKIGFSAPEGVFAVQGNVDQQDWQNMFANVDITVAAFRRHFELDGAQITCLGLGESFYGGVKVENPLPRKFHIVLGHVPNFAMGRLDADLLVAGHTHGGQVRLPFYGPLLTLAQVPRAWSSGMTELSGGGKLLVSRGIGMERDEAPRLRFCCRPELAVIDLLPEK